MAGIGQTTAAVSGTSGRRLAVVSRRGALLLLAAVPVSCASPNPKLYVLAPVPGPTRTGAPRTVALRAPSLARYLERSQIVRSSEGYQLDVLSNDWWGEPLDALMNRVLVQELAQRLPGSTVVADNSAISMTPDATIEINILRFDLDHTGSALLLAQVAVRGRAQTERNVSVTVKPVGATTSDLVAALSNALGQLADSVAAMLAGR